MDAQLIALAERCLRAAEDGTMTFPAIVGTLIDAGFESYMIDFRKSEAAYYLPDGRSVTFPTHANADPVGAAFDARAIDAAIKEAQALVAGYTYQSFCSKVTAAGCAGYMVSFSGRRAVYYGRTGESHTELFPGR